MSLPFDISEKLKSVQVRHYVEWLGRDSHCGYGFAFGYDEKSYRLIDELFQMLQDVETDDEDGAKELWLCARRGTIDDFAKQYGILRTICQFPQINLTICKILFC